jgi:hypothetical protein
MSTFVRILKSDDVENEERQVARMKKEIEFLTIDLQVHEERLQKMRQK